MARRAAIAALATAAAAVGLIIALSGGAHTVRAVFAAALQLRAGNEVRIAGRKVGSVRSVVLSNDRAVVTIGLDDSSWPLHLGTTAEIRYGAAAAYASRFVQLSPGPANAPALAGNALLPENDTATPVEFDQIYSAFDAPARRNLGGTIAGAADTLNGHAADLVRDFELGGIGAERTSGMLGDLGLDPAALASLVTAGASTASTLRANDPQLRSLVTNAADTFSVFGDNATALQATLAKLPNALTSSQTTLRHLNRTLRPLSALTADIAPGAAGLREVAPRLRGALQTLEQIGPSARSTLALGARNLPLLSRFLDSATTFTPGFSSALAQLAPMVGCIRPYAPEIGGYLEDWQAGAFDHVGHYGTVDLIQTSVPPGTTLSSAQAVAASSGALQYAFPRPPGLSAGKPWFQPQCGAGPDALNPAKDPEAGK